MKHIYNVFKDVVKRKGTVTRETADILEDVMKAVVNSPDKDKYYKYIDDIRFNSISPEALADVKKLVWSLKNKGALKMPEPGEIAKQLVKERESSNVKQTVVHEDRSPDPEKVEKESYNEKKEDSAEYITFPSGLKKKIVKGKRNLLGV